MIKKLLVSLFLVSSFAQGQEISKIKKIVKWNGEKVEFGTKKPIKLEDIDYIELNNSLIINNEEIKLRVNEINNTILQDNLLINNSRTFRTFSAGDGGTSGGGG